MLQLSDEFALNKKLSISEGNYSFSYLIDHVITHTLIQTIFSLFLNLCLAFELTFRFRSCLKKPPGNQIWRLFQPMTKPLNRKRKINPMPKDPISKKLMFLVRNHPKMQKNFENMSGLSTMTVVHDYSAFTRYFS